MGCDTITPLDRAIRCFLEPGAEFTAAQGRFAAALGVSYMTVSQWRKRGVPAEWCRKVEALVDEDVTAEELQPAIFCKVKSPKQRVNQQADTA